MKITVFSTTTCPYCKMLKDYLVQNKVLFEEKLVDQDENVKQEMMSKSGGYLGVPFTIIQKDGLEKSVIGFNKSELSQIIGIEA